MKVGMRVLWALTCWCSVAAAVASLERAAGASCTNGVCPDVTSMMQLGLQLTGTKPGVVEHREAPNPVMVQHNAAGERPRSTAYRVKNTHDHHCLPFETSTGRSGLPVCVEALIFGLFSAASLPIGAILAAWLSPSETVTGNWLALGAGALVFSVATQLYGNSLFALLAISRKYGPFDEGCRKLKGMGMVSVCDEKFYNMVVQCVAGLVGAALFYMLDRWLRGAPGTRENEEAAVKPSGSSDYHVALSIWLGMLLDSIPEALMLGLMTNRHELSFGFLFAIFLSNFPEAFSTSALMVAKKMSPLFTLFLWSSIFIVTGLISMVGSWAMPENCGSQMFTSASLFGSALLQGITGGAMLAMMATAMLPVAYKKAQDGAGFYFVFGFAIAIFIQALDSYLASPQQITHKIVRARHAG